MIKAEFVSGRVLKVVAPTKLQSGDFAELAQQVDPLIKREGQVRLIIDATGLEGWENIKALEEHAAFVKSHQQKVDRIAVIAQHEWQHWLVGAIKVFLHPEVRVFDKSHESAALDWVTSSGSTT